MTYQKILVAVDSSKRSYKGLQKAIEIAKENQGEIILAHVIETWNHATMTSSIVLDEEIVQGEHLLNQYKQEVIESGIERVHTSLEFGTPQGV